MWKGSRLLSFDCDIDSMWNYSGLWISRNYPHRWVMKTGAIYFYTPYFRSGGFIKSLESTTESISNLQTPNGKSVAPTLV